MSKHCHGQAAVQMASQKTLKDRMKGLGITKTQTRENCVVARHLARLVAGNGF